MKNKYDYSKSELMEFDSISDIYYERFALGLENDDQVEERYRNVKDSL